MAFNHKEKSFD